MKKKLENRKILTAIVVFLFVSIAMYLILDTSKNTFAVETPPDDRFDDINFYNCIRDHFNNPPEQLPDSYLQESMKLTCQNREIKSIKGIELLINVTNMDLSHNEIETVDLSGLNRLVNIDLSFNRITNINIGDVPEIILNDNELEENINVENSRIDALVIYNNFIGERSSAYDNLTQSEFGYIVTFHSNGGTAVRSQNRKSTVLEPEDPTKIGYTFGGWYTDSELTNKFDFDSTITADTDLYAKWILNEQPHTIGYSCGEGVTGCPGSTSGTGDDLTISSSIPQKEGYEFTYWTIEGTDNKYCYSTNYECSTIIDFSSLGTNNITLVANWRELEQNNQTPTTYKLTYTCGGVTCSGLLGVPITSQSRTINITNIIPTRSDGKLFLHWIYKRNNGEIQKYCNPAKEECPSEITFPTGVTEITLEAVWEEDKPDDEPTKPTTNNQDEGVTNPGTGGKTVVLAIILVLLVVGAVYYSLKKTNK